MATIGELRARRDEARRTAEESDARLAEAVAAIDLRGEIDKIEAPSLIEYRLLTDEQAMRAALGDATGQAAAEIAEQQRAAIAEIDRNYAENARDAGA